MTEQPLVERIFNETFVIRMSHAHYQTIKEEAVVEDFAVKDNTPDINGGVYTWDNPNEAYIMAMLGGEAGLSGDEELDALTLSSVDEYPLPISQIVEVLANTGHLELSSPEDIVTIYNLTEAYLDEVNNRMRWELNYKGIPQEDSDKLRELAKILAPAAIAMENSGELGNDAWSELLGTMTATSNPLVFETTTPAYHEPETVSPYGFR